MFENSQQALEHNFHNSQFHHLQLNWTCELSSNNSFEFELRDSVGNKHRKLVQSFIWTMKMPRMDRIAVSDSQTDWINIWSNSTVELYFKTLNWIRSFLYEFKEFASKCWKVKKMRRRKVCIHIEVFLQESMALGNILFLMPRIGVRGKWTELSWVFRSALTGKLLEFLKVLLEISKLY